MSVKFKPNCNLSIDEKIEKLLQPWPKQLCDKLNQYSLGNNKSSENSQSYEIDNYPLWIQIICTLFDELKIKRIISDDNEDIISDAVWIQYILVMGYRIKDDLIDGDAECGNLLYASDLFILESIRHLEKYSAIDKSISNSFFNILEFSINSAIISDDEQQKCSTNPDQLFKRYEDMCSIFSIGIMLICKMYDFEEALDRLIKFNRKILAALQITDDILDMEEDLSRGRFNYAALALLKKSERSYMSNSLVQEDLGVIFKEEGLSHIFKKILNEITYAKEYIKGLEFKKLEKLLDQNAAKIQKQQEFAHKLRVQLIFGEYLS